MDLLFVSSTSTGGSGRSQRELARRLADHGHDVRILADPKTDGLHRTLYRRQVNLTTKLRGRPQLRRLLLAPQRRFGARPALVDTSTFPTWFSPMPENAYRTLARKRRPDVVVASSVDRVSWRRLRAQLMRAGIPSVLYLREEAALGHLAVTGALPDLLLANARSLVAAARELDHECTFVPSVVELDWVRPPESADVVLMVNPIASHGVDLVWSLARERPAIPFVFQESWLLDDADRAHMEQRVALTDNVTLRHYSTDPSAIYRDARLLIAPHRVDNRPRVILEAQRAGIPVLASAHPGLVESVGAGGLTVEPEASIDQWLTALDRLWSDPACHAEASVAALEHARRPEVDANAVARQFVDLLVELVGAAHPEHPPVQR